MYPTSKIETDGAKNVAEHFRQPAGPEDTEHLRRSCARLWPAMWFCIIVVVIVVAACVVA